MDTTRQDSGTLSQLRQKMEDYQREIVRKNQEIEELMTERNKLLDYQLDQIRDRDREMRELEGINVKEEGELKMALKLDEMNDKYMKTIQYYQDQIKNKDDQIQNLELLVQSGKEQQENKLEKMQELNNTVIKEMEAINKLQEKLDEALSEVERKATQIQDLEVKLKISQLELLASRQLMNETKTRELQSAAAQSSDTKSVESLVNGLREDMSHIKEEIRNTVHAIYEELTSAMSEESEDGEKSVETVVNAFKEEVGDMRVDIKDSVNSISRELSESNTLMIQRLEQHHSLSEELRSMLLSGIAEISDKFHQGNHTDNVPEDTRPVDSELQRFTG